MDNEEEKKKKLIVYGMYSNFIKEVKHFDKMQIYFRILTSTVLLGSFAAIGFIFSIAKLVVPFERSFSACLVSLIGITAIFTLWYVDLKFYEKLLVSNFAEAFRLEKEYAWLPKVHHNMLFASNKKDHPTNIANFYIGGISTLLITIGFAVFYDLYYVHNKHFLGFLSFFSTLLLICFFYFSIKKKTKSINELLAEIKYIED